MERPKKLSATFVKTISAPGRYGDGRGGHGLSLLVKPSSTGRVRRIWCQRLRIDGKAVDLGIGSFPVTTLAEARAKALANRRSIEHGQDPRTKVCTVPTFSQAVEAVIDLHQANWKNPRVAGQWRASERVRLAEAGAQDRCRYHHVGHYGRAVSDMVGETGDVPEATPAVGDGNEVGGCRRLSG